MGSVNTTDLSLSPAVFSACDVNPAGQVTLAALLELATRAITRLQEGARHGGAAVARLRGNGPGLSFRQAVSRLEAELPIDLVYPFESNDRVGGAVWPLIPGDASDQNAVMKLRWECQADDLPMHTHEHSDRCIIVLEGRGFFHVTGEAHAAFTGSGIQTIAARERDVLSSRGAWFTPSARSTSRWCCCRATCPIFR